MLAPLIFDSVLLSELAAAVERRGKAIRYHSTLKCAREQERNVERLDIAIIGLTCLHCSVWDDGSFWLCITKPSPRRTGGWAIHEQFDGHLREILPAEFVTRLEHTHSFTNVKDILRERRDQHLARRSV
ncbi:MAG: hypothetical protein QOG67_12 [Verrucomicrobiota bacterium]